MPILPALTDQQQAIVAHNTGPALVFAVAGAGKTTTLVHRVARLVREGVFRADRILVTSFGRATVNGIRAALARWPACAPVTVSTLHRVGNQTLRLAEQRGRFRRAANAPGADGLDYQILGQARALARSRKAPFMAELDGLDEQDFLDFVGRCKGNLAYADLDRVALPAEARRVASQAVAPPNLAWYLDFYRLYEEVRQRQGWVTYDDMLMTGWELLVKHPDLLAAVRGQYECVLVDEFQDINLAQSEILDLITAPHRNYMAIGDDDQTIYEWRGANPQFILDFPARYKAAVYPMTDCFRCRASQIVLANRVIEHNRVRRPKRLGLTQGFDGATQVHWAADQEALGRAVVAEIQSALARGVAPTDMAVLVRLYAQTPYIEQALIEQGIPHRVEGSAPFYRRPEVQWLLDYVTLARAERAMSQRQALDAPRADDFARAWGAVYFRPKRYITKDVAERVRAAVVEDGRTPCEALRQASFAAPTPRLAEPLTRLARDLEWLARVSDTLPAADVLRELEARLQFGDYLRRSSGFRETGEGKAAGVMAFIDYARGKGRLADFTRHLDQLAARDAQADAARPAVLITTIFRAKGLEWPVVFVPHVNDGVLPFGEAERLEEERRLLYVAITRARRDLHLFCLKDQPLSPFLTEAGYRDALRAVETLRTTLAQPVEAWRAKDALLAARYVQHLGLDRYLRLWWRAEPASQREMAHAVQRAYSALAARRGKPLSAREQADLEPWRAIAPLPADERPTDFLGLDEALAHYRQAQARLKAQPQPATARSSPAPARSTHVQHSQYGTGRLLSARDGFATVEFAVWGKRRVPLTTLGLDAEFEC